MSHRDPEVVERTRGGRRIPSEGLPYGGTVDDRTQPGPPRPPGGDWRDEVATASGLNIIAGIWLIIAPFVLNYQNGDPYWNDIVFGAIVAIIGLIRVSGAYREHWLSWINALIGVWIFISAFWLDNTGRSSANDIILGVIVFVLAAASASAGAAEPGVAASRWRR